MINVPEEALEGGMTAESVERKLSIEDKSQWRQRRKNVDLLILMDFVSKSIESLHTLDRHTSLQWLLRNWPGQNSLSE